MLLLVHLLSAVARVLGPGGAKALVAENLLIKQQLLILTRSRQRAANLTSRERILLGLWSLFLRPARLHNVAVALRAATLLAFHQRLLRRKYRALFASSGHRKPGAGGASWRTFIGHMKDSLWRVDLFRCESITLNTHWVLVVMDQFTRRLIGFGIQAGAVDGIALCRMVNHAIAGAIG